MSNSAISHKDATLRRMSRGRRRQQTQCESRSLELGRGAERTVGVNPFEAYLEGGSIRTVNELVQKTIPELLGGLRQPRPLVVDEFCSLYKEGRRFQKKHGISEQSFQKLENLALQMDGHSSTPLTQPQLIRRAEL